MKKTVLILSLLILAIIPSLRAQETLMDEINYNQLQKYIEMAKEYYPQRQILAEQEKIAKNDLSAANVSFLDPFSASYFYRPDEKDAINPQNPYLYNGFQLSATINLGDFLQKPFQSKSAKSNLKIAQLERQIYDTELEKEVKNRYYDYIFQVKALKVQTIAAQDATGTFQTLTNRFEKGEVTLEEYNEARAAIAVANTSKIETEKSYLQAKDNLEEIIGVKLSDVK